MACHHRPGSSELTVLQRRGSDVLSLVILRCGSSKAGPAVVGRPWEAEEMGKTREDLPEGEAVVLTGMRPAGSLLFEAVCDPLSPSLSTLSGLHWSYTPLRLVGSSFLLKSCLSLVNTAIIYVDISGKVLWLTMRSTCLPPLSLPR